MHHVRDIFHRRGSSLIHWIRDIHGHEHFPKQGNEEPQQESHACP